MSTDPASSSSPHHITGADPAEVLAIVAATVPLRLPKPTEAALRLVCRATKLSVDQSKRHLNLRLDKMGPMRLEDNPLTSGLEWLRFFSRHLHYGPENIANACMLACHNSSTLESCEFPSLAGNALDALGTLGSREWPNLKSLRLHSMPGLAQRLHVENMPQLTALHLSGQLEPADVAALLRCTRFTSKVEELTVGVCTSSKDSNAMFEQVSALLHSTPKLRSLSLSLCDCRDLDFLATAALPCLEFLYLHGFEDISFEPLVRVARPRLQTLILASMATPTDLLPLVTRSWALPALTDLNLGSFMLDDWSFLREIELRTLETLSFSDGCWMTAADLELVGVAAARLPVLETLELTLANRENEGETSLDAAAAMRALLSGPPLPRLQCLITGEQLEGDDASLKCMIKNAGKVPQMEVIEMAQGRISAAGFTALAAAGRRGVWPNLELVQIAEFVGGDPEPSIRKLRRVWPGLSVDIMRG